MLHSGELVYHESRGAMEVYYITEEAKYNKMEIKIKKSKNVEFEYINPTLNPKVWQNHSVLKPKYGADLKPGTLFKWKNNFNDLVWPFSNNILFLK